MKKNLLSFTGSPMSNIKVEYDIQEKYRNFYVKSLGLEFNSPFQSDGYGVNKKKDIYMVTEFKKSKNFLNNREHLVQVLVQCTYVLRKFFINNWKTNVLLVADKDEFFILDPRMLSQYFCLDIDWSYSPSQAHDLKNELYSRIYENKTISPVIFTLNDDNLESSKKIICDTAKECVVRTKITPSNFPIAMENFKNILASNYSLPTNRLANLLAQIIINPDGNNLPGAKGLKFITTKSEGNVPIKSRESWENFWNHYEKNYSLEDKDSLAASVDRIVEDLVRRKQGEFFTPNNWVDKAHEYVSEVFPNWRQKYIVWDSCWGTGNLTRGYHFSNLVATTLHNSDIETAKQSNYNNEAKIREVFDFLNHPDEYYPEIIKKAISEKRELFFLINPPYATSNVAGNNSDDKEGVSQTEINKLMKLEGGWGKSTQQLYSQFIYRIMRIPTKTHLCIFSKPTFLTGDAFTEFRGKFFENFEFKKGFVMNSNEFADVKSWPLTFSIFEDKKQY